MRSHERKEGMSKIGSVSGGTGGHFELASRGEPLVRGSGRRLSRTVDAPVWPMHSGGTGGHREVDRH